MEEPGACASFRRQRMVDPGGAGPRRPVLVEAMEHTEGESERSFAYLFTSPLLAPMLLFICNSTLMNILLVKGENRVRIIRVWCGV